MFKIVQFLIILTVVSFFETSLADVIIIKNNETIVFSRPSSHSKKVTRLKRGRQLQTVGGPRNGFYQLKTRSGRKLYVRKSDVKARSIQDDLISGESRPPRSRQQNPRRLHLDLGVSTGQSGDTNYTEANLGLSYFFTPWLSWRNAGFYRFIDLEGVDDFYGLDSSLRGTYRAQMDRQTGLTLFGGSGIRVPSKGPSLPLAEAGLVLKVLGFSLGGGAKVLFNKWVDDQAAENDVQYFLILSGSTSL